MKIVSQISNNQLLETSKNRLSTLIQSHTDEINKLYNFAYYTV